jgi:hypothetical protein
VPEPREWTSSLNSAVECALIEFLIGQARCEFFSTTSMQDSKKADLPSKRSSPSPTLDSPSDSPSDPNPVDPDMALVAHNNPASLLTGTAGINKRYRPAPAKTFQCRGYGECRMVFSRSEHLARHIRHA